MRYIKKAVWFITAVFSRILPFIIVMLIHAFGEVYTFSWDPIALLQPKNIPVMYGPFLYLYAAIGLLIVLLFFMNLPVIARSVILGVIGAQYFMFMRIWDNYINEAGKEEPYKTFYMIIPFSVIAGFILQVTWRSSTAFLKRLWYKQTIKDRKAKR